VAGAGSRLTGAERDMADRLGIRVRDRGALAGEIAAVLRREPDAVGRTRRGLEALRDRAAAELAFERAAKIQAEIEALDWITCSQRVALLDGPDLTIQGWADGVLVEWTMRAGRLGRWRQRRAREPRTAATPAAWVAFARRNAELAARLISR
jgi:excinuclease ABC subunit C